MDIGLGGSLGKDAAFIDWVEGAKPADEVPDALENVFQCYKEERREGERFHEWARRKRNKELRQTILTLPEMAGPERKAVRLVAGFDIREMMNDIDEAPGKVWFWDLEKAVIDADRCVQCGVCVAACPTDSIGIGEDDLPSSSRCAPAARCAGTSARAAGLQYESTWKIMGADRSVEGVGHVEESYTARVNPMIEGVQDGGFVSALLISRAGEAGEIDGALLAKESATERWKGEAFLATTPDEVRECAGSFYNQTLALGHVDFNDYDLPPNPRIAVVGTPCEIEGIKAMQARPWTWGVLAGRGDNADHRAPLHQELQLREADAGGDPGQARRGPGRTSAGWTSRGKMIVQDLEGETIFEEPIRDFHGAALKGCDECADFMGHAADISVGSVGSADGYSSVL